MNIQYVAYTEKYSDTLDETFYTKNELLTYIEKSLFNLSDVSIHKVSYPDINSDDVRNIKIELDEENGNHIAFIDCLIDDKKTECGFIVQTTNAGDYEPQSGCYFHGNSDNSFTHNEFSIEEKLISKLIDIPLLVENKLLETYKLLETDFNCTINSCNLYIKENKTGEKYTLVTLDDNHNSSCDYGDKMTEYDSFDSHKEAMEFLDQFRTNEHHDFQGFNNFLNYYTDKDV